MSSASPTSRAARVTLVMSCLFATSGVVLVFLPRWLEVERGLSGAQIGALLSLSQAARVITGPALAAWADSVRDRRLPLRVLSLAALAAYAAFFTLAKEYWQLLVLGFVALSLSSGVTPFVEGAMLRATAQGRLPYGVGRAIGSVAFIIANVAGGFLISSFGLGAVVIWVLTSLTSLILSSWLVMSPDPAPADAHPRAPNFEGARRLLQNRRFLILIVSCGLIQSAHAFYYNFSTLTWRAQGISVEAVGFLWAVGVAAEVVFLLCLPLIEKRVAPAVLILVGAGGGLVRWTIAGFAPDIVLLWPLQMLHALTFAAAHVGAMRLLYREAPESSSGMAQTLYAVLSGGILMGASTLLSGYMYDAIGARGYWAMAVLALTGGTLALALLSPAPRRSNPA